MKCKKKTTIKGRDADRRKARNGRRVPPENGSGRTSNGRVCGATGKRAPSSFPGTPFIIPFFARKDNEKNAERNFRRFFLKISPIFSNPKSFWVVFEEEKGIKTARNCFLFEFLTEKKTPRRSERLNVRTSRRRRGKKKQGTLRLFNSNRTGRRGGEARKNRERSGFSKRRRRVRTTISLGTRRLWRRFCRPTCA